VREVFDEFGEIVEVVILRDRRTNMHQVASQNALRCHMALHLTASHSVVLTSGMLLRQVLQSDISPSSNQRAA